LKTTDQILITGATGMLGQELVKQLLERGFSKLVLCVRPESVLPVEWTSMDGIQVVRGDLMDYFQVDEWMEGADYVFHLAGSTSAKAGSRDSLIATNIILTRTWVNVALDKHLKGFVHLSSAAALGRKKDGTPCNENDSWQKNEVFSDYNKSKFLGEMEVARAQQEGLHTIILNPTFMIGNGGILHWAQRLLSQNCPYFPVGTGGYVDVRDVAMFAIEAVIAGLWGEKYILNSENKSHEKFFQLVAKAMGVDLPRRPAKASLFRHQKLLQFWRRDKRFQDLNRLNTEWFRILQSNLAYDNSKSLKTGLVSFMPISESLAKNSDSLIGSTHLV